MCECVVLCYTLDVEMRGNATRCCHVTQHDNLTHTIM
jgi:hypothetical protein